MSPDCDVAVVGAGLAGLTAARRLVWAGLDVRVLEARDRVGGRLLPHPLGPGAEDVVELGGQWVGPTQHRAHALARDLGVATFPTYVTGENLFEDARGRVRRYRGTIPKLNPVVLADYGQAAVRLDRLARRVDPETPWLARGAERLDGQTFATWIRRATTTPTAREAFVVGCRAVFSVEPTDLSLLHVCFYLASAGGWDALLDTEGGAQQDRLVGGSHRLASGLAEALGERVLLERPVTSIRQDDEGVEVAGIRAGRVVVALPPTLAGRISFDPPLPASRDQLTQRVPMGSVIKTMAVYDRPFWRERGLTGSATSLAGPGQVVFDNTPSTGGPGVLLAFLEGREARELGRVPESERRTAVLGTLTRLFGPEARSPVDFIEHDWAADSWSRGAYAGVLGPGTWTAHGPALRAPVGRLHWAGTETATRWSGYFDGAIQSGERVAAEILAAGQEDSARAARRSREA